MSTATANTKKASAKKKAPPAPTVAETIHDLAEQVRRYRFENRETMPTFSERAKLSVVLLSQLEKHQLNNIGIDKLITCAHAAGLRLTITLAPNE